MVKNAFTNPDILKYKDQLVCIKVLRDTMLITPASEKQAQHSREKSQSKNAVALSCDNSFRQLAGLKDLNIKTINIAGGKPSNMGELAKIMVDKTRPLPIPQNVFAIPFYFYNQHINDHHIEPLISALLNDKSIWEDHTKLAEKLKDIRDNIESAPLNEDLLKMVVEEIGQNKDLNFRFRSSTNAEDVPGFNGAGLYDSKTGCVTSARKPVDKAIKEVWASLWKERAFEERVFFNIDQSNLAMGILINRAFGTEEANSVAITKNLYRDDYPAFTINVQKGEESIVQPDDSIRAEQFLVNFSPISNDRVHDLAVDYICHSSLQPDTPVLTKDEIRLLADYLLAIKTHYWLIFARRGISFNNLGMDVEFKLDHKTRKIVIKQARLYWYVVKEGRQYTTGVWFLTGR